MQPLLLLLLVPLLALAQNTPSEYLQICPTPDCVARDAALSITATTGLPHETSIGGYIRGLHPQSNAVGLFSLATRETAGGSWAMNTLMQDAETRAVHSNTGRYLIGAELDFNVMGPSAVIGVSVGGNGLAQPASANGFVANTLGAGLRWNTAFNSMDGAAENALFIGSLDAANSQRIMFRSGSHIQLLQASDGLLRLYSTGANGLRVEYGNVYADKFVPNAAPALGANPTTAEIAAALRALGLVQ